MTLKIGICGGDGRMGKILTKVISSSATKYSLVGQLTRSSTPIDINNLCNTAEVIVDFSIPDALPSLITSAKSNKTKLLIGTTGLSTDHFKMMREAENDIAILFAPNTSLGANLVAFLSATAAKILSSYDVEIIEAHHKHKQDSPSGAALMIGQEISNTIGVNLDEKTVFNRHLRGKRKDGEISFASIRGGGIFGEHTVIIAGDHEVVKIEHQALSRDLFAEGALIAASWLDKQKPGLYSMKDMLGWHNTISHFK
jgi:4-hydroxy-tetrahydrodipicolinate reductase